MQKSAEGLTGRIAEGNEFSDAPDTNGGHHVACCPIVGKFG